MNVNLLEAGRNTILRGSPFAGFFTISSGEVPYSVEVFLLGEHDTISPGWYWWVCSPGCLPDSDPLGPFPEAEGAFLDAIGE